MLAVRKALFQVSFRLHGYRKCDYEQQITELKRADSIMYVTLCHPKYQLPKAIVDLDLYKINNLKIIN